LPGVSGVFYIDIIYEIRRRYALQKQSISAIVREMGVVSTNGTQIPQYGRRTQIQTRVQPISPKLGEFEGKLMQWLEEEAQLARP
jgi:hypothetical protein